MDYDANIQKFANYAYVIEKPAEQCLLADQASQFMAKKGLRMSFRKNSSTGSDTLHRILPESIGVISREDATISNKTESTTALTSPSPPSSTKQKSNFYEEKLALSAINMLGRSFCNNDPETVAVFSALIAIQNSFERSSIEAISSFELSNHPTLHSKSAIAASVQDLLIKQVSIKTQLDSRNFSLEDVGKLALDYVSKYGHKTPIALASLEPSMSEYRYNDTEAKNTTRNGPPYKFEVHEFGKSPIGPSYLNQRLFNKFTLKEIQGVHADLLKVVNRAREISSIDFEVVPGNGGIRSETEQKKLKRAGKSHASFGRHTIGYAIDLVPSINMDSRISPIRKASRSSDKRWSKRQLSWASPFSGAAIGKDW